MKKLLCVLLFACPIIASERPNIATPKSELKSVMTTRQVLKESETALKISIGMMVVGSIAAAPTAPILVPVAFLANIATRICMEENNKPK